MYFPLNLRAISARVFTVSLSILMIVNLSVVPASAQKMSEEEQPEVRSMEAAPTPIVVSGNPSCATLNASANPAFAHITEDWGKKLDFSPPNGPSGPYFFNSGLTGGAPSDAANSVSINRTGTQTFNWTATRPITAVMVKGGANSNVYPYDPASFGGINGMGLSTTGGAGISHIEFCFELFVIPSAAPVTLTGRVINTNGRGISGVFISATNEMTGEVIQMSTNSFGYYNLENLEVGTVYTIRATAKRYQILDSERTLVLEDNLQGFDFVGIQ